jgi:molybdopterin-guanine dinucleotide biosynthesis protein A
MIAVLLLAGGNATRLNGADKALLFLHGRSLISHLLARLTPQAGNIAISANGDASRFAAYGLPVLPDAPEHAGKGPLAGVAAGLAWAASLEAEALLTIPGDTPFIPQTLISDLAPPPAVACHQGQQQHLVALWPCTFLPALKVFLAGPGPHRVRDALELCCARPVTFDGPSELFMNINTPEDLAAAAQRF